MTPDILKIGADDDSKLLVCIHSESMAELRVGFRWEELKIHNDVFYYHDPVVTDVRVLDSQNNIVFTTSYECHRSITKVLRDEAYKRIDAWIKSCKEDIRG